MEVIPAEANSQYLRIPHSMISNATSYSRYMKILPANVAAAHSYRYWIEFHLQVHLRVFLARRTLALGGWVSINSPLLLQVQTYETRPFVVSAMRLFLYLYSLRRTRLNRTYLVQNSTISPFIQRGLNLTSCTNGAIWPVYHGQTIKASLGLTRLPPERKEKIQEFDPYLMIREYFIKTLFCNFQGLKRILTMQWSFSMINKRIVRKLAPYIIRVVGVGAWVIYLSTSSLVENSFLKAREHLLEAVRDLVGRSRPRGDIYLWGRWSGRRFLMKIYRIDLLGHRTSYRCRIEGWLLMAPR